MHHTETTGLDMAFRKSQVRLAATTYSIFVRTCHGADLWSFTPAMARTLPRTSLFRHLRLPFTSTEAGVPVELEHDYVKGIW